MIRGSGCSKSRLAKAVGAEVAVEHRNEKWHAAAARSTFSSQNVYAKHPSSGAILEVPIWKMARRCGAKHICKSKCAKHHILGAIFEVSIWKNGTPLWRKAHL